MPRVSDRSARQRFAAHPPTANPIPPTVPDQNPPLRCDPLEVHPLVGVGTVEVLIEPDLRGLGRPSHLGQLALGALDMQPPEADVCGHLLSPDDVPGVPGPVALLALLLDVRDVLAVHDLSPLLPSRVGT